MYKVERLCKIVPPCESHNVEQFFAWYVDEAKTHSSQDLEKNGVWNCIFCVREPFVLKSNQVLPFLCLNQFGFINFES